MTKEEYLNSMDNLRPNLYAFGEKVENVLKFAPTRANINAISLTYELADRPVLRAESHLTGETINRFTHVHMNQEDLNKRLEMMKWLTPNHGGCVGARCVGSDAIQAVYATSYDIDEKYGTKYHSYFKDWLKYVQQNDLSVAGMMTDIKGDRSKKPSEQPNPDAYVRVVERRKDGIVVRGAKAHMSGAPVAHEFLVMPTENMREEDKDYAISFAIPNGTPGVTQVFEAAACDFRWLNGEDMDLGNPQYGIHGASLVVFDDVFVPWERVFMCGEWDFSGTLVLRFADMHRFTFVACKSGHCDLVTGAASLAAEMLGTAKVSHVKQKILEVVEMSELAYGCAVGSAALGKSTSSGSYVPSSLHINTAKIQGIKSVYRAAEVAAEIAGGLVCTMPSVKDFNNPDLAPMLEKYLKAKEEFTAKERVRVLRLIEYLMGQGSVIPAESALGGGAPAACRVMINIHSNVKYFKEQAAKISGIR